MLEKVKYVLENCKLGVESLFWKRDDSVVLIGAWFGEKFADNSRFLFQYLSAHKEKHELSHVIWVTRNTKVHDMLTDFGYEVYMMDTPESIMWHKKAKYHIVCNKGCDGSGYKGDILGKYSYRAKRINLWHGVAGIKGVSCSSNEYKEQKKLHPVKYFLKEFLFIHCSFYRLFVREAGGWSDSYILTTTPADTDLMQPRYLLPRTNFIESGFPRNCKVESLTNNEKKVIDFIKDKKVILYLPTFRSDGFSFDAAKVVESQIETLIRLDIIWIQKGHTADYETSFKKYDIDNVLTLDSDFDINVLMPHIDILVTDYSSVASDAMYHNKLVIYYIPDFEEYKASSRGLAVDPESIMCGPKVYNTSELTESIQKYVVDPESGKSVNYQQVRTKYWNEINDLGVIFDDIIKHVNLKKKKKGRRIVNGKITY